MFIRRKTHEALLKDATQEARAMGALAAKYKRERNDAEVALSIARAEANELRAADERRKAQARSNLKQNRQSRDKQQADAGTFEPLHRPGERAPIRDTTGRAERIEMSLTDFLEEETTGQFAASLGPEYFASSRLAEAMINKFDVEHLKPLVDKVADEFREKLWDDVRDYLLADTEQNVAGEVRYMVEQTVNALLIGKEWAMQRYPYADYSKGEEIRAAVAKHAGDTLLARRVADLEAQVEKQRATIEHLRRY